MWRFSAILAGLLLTGCSGTTAYYRSADGMEIVDPLPEEIVTRVVLVGDAGKPAPGAPTMEIVERWASELPAKTIVTFLGDNIYPDGLPDEGHPDYGEARRRLQAQLNAVPEDVSSIFIPGNHDWESGGGEGLANALRQERFVESESHAEVLPDAGGPGPVFRDLDGLRVVIVNTQWWLHDGDKPEVTDREVLREALADVVDTDQPVLFLGHHPLRSHGKHGGHFGWKTHLIPPVFGTLFTWFRPWFNEQDLGNSEYQRMLDDFRRAFAGSSAPLLLYAAGHEHNLQVLDGESVDYVLVSGAGSEPKASVVTHKDDTRFAHNTPGGFMVVDVLTDGSLLLRVVERIPPQARDRIAYKQFLTPRRGL